MPWVHRDDGHHWGPAARGTDHPSIHADVVPDPLTAPGDPRLSNCLPNSLISHDPGSAPYAPEDRFPPPGSHGGHCRRFRLHEQPRHRQRGRRPRRLRQEAQRLPTQSSPEPIAPGALVWFSAYGSHDPDFFGASTRDLRDEARSEGGVHIHNDYEHQEFSWYVTLDSEADDSLGTGIKEYHWRIDGGAPRIAHELTHRYGSEDGPLRFPVGFTEPGTHVITLTVVDWSGARDTVSTKVRVEEGDIDSMLTGWSVTEEGWTYTRNVPVSWMKYGDCQPVRSDYDASVHHVNAPWDLIFFMKDVTVRATWEEVAAPSPPAAGQPQRRRPHARPL